MKRLHRDLVTLFNCLWYRDFPAQREKYIARANWTIHIGVVIRECADLLGYHAAFESHRTDAIILNGHDEPVVNVEWEWDQPFRKKVNEIEKLLKASKGVELSVFVSYADRRYLENSLKRVESTWSKATTPLLLFLIVFKRDKGDRDFRKLVTYRFYKGKRKRLRSQPALPWEVSGARWKES
jgi:hypothetical protein